MPQLDKVSFLVQYVWLTFFFFFFYYFILEVFLKTILKVLLIRIKISKTIDSIKRSNTDGLVDSYRNFFAIDVKKPLVSLFENYMKNFELCCFCGSNIAGAFTSYMSFLSMFFVKYYMNKLNKLNLYEI